MKSMWQSELIRFRSVGLTVMVLHFLVLRGFASFGDFFAPTGGKLGIGLVTYSGLGLALGLYQWGTYKRDGRWLYLIHRPLAPRKIFAALAGAGVSWLVLALALPMWLMTLYVDFFRAEWVDDRAYGLAPFVFLVSAAFYFVGTVVMLHPSRAAALVVALPIFWLHRDGVGSWTYVIAVATVLWLAWVALTAFKPDLKRPVERPAAVLAAALPMQYAVWGVLLFVGTLTWSTQIAFQEHGWRSFAAHAWNDYFPEQTTEHLGYRNSLEVLEHGLKRVDGERAAELLQQIELAERFELAPQLRQAPTLGQPVFLDRLPPVLIDPENEISWVFSHDRRLLQGRDTRGGSAAGWMGIRGPLEASVEAEAEDLFDQVPSILGKRFLLSGSRVHELLPKQQRLVHRFTAEGERVVTAPQTQGSVMTLLTDQHLYLFESREWQKRYGPVEPIAAIPLPGELRRLSRITVAELIDGFLLSFTLDMGSRRGFYPSEQVMAELRLGEELEILERIPLAPGEPDWLRHRGFIYSPVMQTLHDLAWSAIAPAREDSVSPRQIFGLERPGPIRLAAFVVSILCAVVTVFSARRRAFDLKRLVFWGIWVLLMGLPGMLVYFCLAPRRPVSLPVAEGSASTVGLGTLAGADGWSAT